jgi:hypothetical protein
MLSSILTDPMSGNPHPDYGTHENATAFHGSFNAFLSKIQHHQNQPQTFWKIFDRETQVNRLTGNKTAFQRGTDLLPFFPFLSAIYF